MLEQVINGGGIVLGISGFMIALTKFLDDFLLSQKQKDWLKSKSELFWYWLSKQKAGKFIPIFLKERNQKILIFAVHLLILVWATLDFYPLKLNDIILFWNGRLALLIFQDQADQITKSIIIILSLIVNLRYFHPLFFKRFSSKNPLKNYFVLNLILFIIFFGIFMSFFKLYVYLNYESSMLILVMIYFFVIFFYFLCTIFSILLILGFIWLVFVYILMLITKFFEIIILRIAEAPKGPIYAMGAILTFIGAIITIFLGK